jgi:hypothetical protein
MKSGGTIDVQAFINDLRQVQNNTYPALNVIKLPLPNVFTGTTADYPDLDLTNYFGNIRDLVVVDIPMPQAGNFFALVQYAMDANGKQIAPRRGARIETALHRSCCGL